MHFVQAYVQYYFSGPGYLVSVENRIWCLIKFFIVIVSRMGIAMIAYLDLFGYFQTIPCICLINARKYMFANNKKCYRNFFIINDVKHILCAFVRTIIKREIIFFSFLAELLLVQSLLPLLFFSIGLDLTFPSPTGFEQATR